MKIRTEIKLDSKMTRICLQKCRNEKERKGEREREREESVETET